MMVGLENKIKYRTNIILQIQTILITKMDCLISILSEEWPLKDVHTAATGLLEAPLLNQRKLYCP